MEYCRVIVDGAPFVNEDGFTYRVPPFLEQSVAIGSIVYVPFGKGDKLKIGFVVSEEAAVETEAAHKIKDIVMINHLSPVVTPELMALCRFVADSYACALIYALRQVVPKYMLHHAFVAFEEIESGKRTALNRRSIKDGAAGCAAGTLRLVPHEPTAEPGERFWQLTSEESATIEAWMIALKRAPKQKAVLQFILQQGIVDGERLNEAFDGCQPTLRTLREKGYIRECARPAAKATDEHALQPELVMTERQQAVFDALRTQLDAHAYHKSLINGVTGSGKTLIYEKLTETVIAHRRQALILVPEIALSQQLFERLQKRFGALGLTRLPDHDTCLALLSESFRYAALYELRSNLFDYHLEEDRLVTADNWKDTIRFHFVQYQHIYEQALDGFYAAVLSRKLLLAEFSEELKKLGF